ncbi:hypothetical protein HYH03_006207 [Edaphochlamys debaryana]|uniref:EGF-like domain-containing protein n=1 Tax=Edaphochlamys debaryana TaxID=47281 RepID=A0A835Y5Q7_9CHLO|nr:hypothetical protein HYH03_006207 [Edaphochlamys debaryana]|eukprot:KAG2495607.1 hypothetical protein HYH03_006207 [Edaphochlamys debaryana]
MAVVVLIIGILALGASSMTCPDGCTRYGSCNAELGRCDCLRHMTGPDCGSELDPQALEQRCKALAFRGVESCMSAKLACPNSCSGVGKCVAGVCHCSAGKFGSDCSLSLGPDGKPRLLADRGYTPRARGPRVYVYELPPAMNTWVNEARLDRPTTRLFQQRLVATGARVADGDNADWWFIPITLRLAGQEQVLALLRAIHYIRLHHPWWNRTMGHRHFVIALEVRLAWEQVAEGGRFPADELDGVNLFRDLTFVTNWGLHKDRERSSWRATHRNATDIVLPVFLKATRLGQMKIVMSRHHPLFPSRAPPELRERSGPFFWFAGRICGDASIPRLDGVWPHCQTTRSWAYSGGVRQLVHYLHHNRTGFFIRTGDERYGEHLLTSKYCFGPMGGGHGQRQIQAALAGCVPVVISDGVLESFEPYLDWNEFGVRVAEADIPRLHEILGAISPEEYARKVPRLRCAAQHLAFSTVTGSTMGESGRFDAFETLLEVLRAKAEHPGVAPEGLRRVDARLDAFMECRGEEEGEGAEGVGRIWHTVLSKVCER